MEILNGCITKVYDQDIKLLKSNPKQFWNGVKSIKAFAFTSCTAPFDIEIPKGITVSSCAFASSMVRSAVLPSNLKELKSKMFYGCYYLEKVVIPEHIEVIPESCFNGCENLESINCENVRTIKEYAFAGCGLTSVNLSNITEINDNAFEKCSYLQKVTLGKNEKSKNVSVGFNAFEYCLSLKEVENSGLINDLGLSSFANCQSLKSFDLTNVTQIHRRCFYNCKNLTDVTFSDSEKIIEEGAFQNTNLEHIDINLKPMHNVGISAFENCRNLKTAKLSSNRYVLMQNQVFKDCVNLETASLPQLYHRLPYKIFANCNNLKKVDIQYCEELQILDQGCFENCYNLTNINNAPTHLTLISKDCFKNCNNLIKFPINNECKFSPNSVLKYVCKTNNGFFTSNQPISDDYIMLNGEYDYLKVGLYTRFWKNEKIKNTVQLLDEKSLKIIDNSCFDDMLYQVDVSVFLNDWENPKARNFLKSFEFIDSEIFSKQLKGKIITNFSQLYKELNLDLYLKFLNNLQKQSFNIFETESSIKCGLFRLYFNLGGMKNLTHEITSSNGKTSVVSYDQQISELLTKLLCNNKLTINDLMRFRTQLDVDGFKQEFTDFLLSKKDKHTYNFEDMLDMNNAYPTFFANCYNNFEKIQISNKSNKGSQRQLKPSMEHFKNQFFKCLKGTNEHNLHIAKAILSNLKGSNDLLQIAFNHAREINIEILGYRLTENYFSLKPNQKNEVLSAIEYNDKELLEQYNNCFELKEKIENHILSTPLNEEIYNQKFSRLDSIIEKCDELSKNILTECADIAQNFTFEWLSKDDARNFVLGKLCDCCAHLEGAGYGIMHASIVHPNVQNLVIKNNNGDIVAKSTLYLNKKAGYAVFNNVEVSHKFKKSTDLQEIYEKFMLGTKAFVEQYQQESNLPLEIITVGAGNNDLRQFFALKHKSSEIYPTINYSTYGLEFQCYNNDSDFEQFEVYNNIKQEVELDDR